MANLLNLTQLLALYTKTVGELKPGDLRDLERTLGNSKVIQGPDSARTMEQQIDEIAPASATIENLELAGGPNFDENDRMLFTATFNVPVDIDDWSVVPYFLINTGTDNLRVEADYFYGGPRDQLTFSVAATDEVVIASNLAFGAVAIASKKTFSFTNGGLVVSAAVAGVAGDAIGLEFGRNGDSQTLLVSKTDDDITVRLATDENGDVTSTYGEVIAALAVEGTTAAVLDPDEVGLANEDVIVTTYDLAGTFTPLAGGEDADAGGVIVDDNTAILSGRTIDLSFVAPDISTITWNGA